MFADDPKEIGKRIKLAMELHPTGKKSQKWLAQRCSVTQGNVSQWWKGKQIPKALDIIAELLLVNIKWLRNGTEPMRMPDGGFEFKEPRPSSIRPGDFPQTPITAKTDVRSLAKYVVEKELGIFNPSEEERIYVEERIAGQIGIDDYLGRTVKPENYSSAAIDALRAFRVEKGVKRPG